MECWGNLFCLNKKKQKKYLANTSEQEKFGKVYVTSLVHLGQAKQKKLDCRNSNKGKQEKYSMIYCEVKVLHNNLNDCDKYVWLFQTEGSGIISCLLGECKKKNLCCGNKGKQEK